MSESSLWAIDKDNSGEEVREYRNSWLFNPIIWDELMWKYLNNKNKGKFDFKARYLTDAKAYWKPLNEKLNNSTVLDDRIMWELSQQQIMLTANKAKIAKAIRSFIKTIIEKSEEGYGDHITKRFEDIAKDIENLDEDKVRYFAIKGTSCDDGIERLFRKEDGEEMKLDEWGKIVCEFVIINEDDTITFKNNLKMYEK